MTCAIHHTSDRPSFARTFRASWRVLAGGMACRLGGHSTIADVRSMRGVFLQ